MEILVYPDPSSVAQAAADFIERRARECLTQSARFVMAVSGGHTPQPMLRALAERVLGWERVHVFQVDERVAPDGDPERNWTHLQKSLGPLWARIGPRVYPMPVTHADLEAGAAEYAATLLQVTDEVGSIDLVHLGLGDDGHTASLVPNDPALRIRDRDVTVIPPYRGLARMTLTFAAINRARQVLWVVVGADKHPALTRLLQGDSSIPAGLVSDDNATVIADAAAVGGGAH